MVPPPRVLEISILSARDLALVSRSMKTYSVAWVDPERKLTSLVDQDGLNNPSWNEKFVFRVPDRFLADEDSSVMIEIYATAWLKDALIGSACLFISHLFGSLTHSHSSSCTRYVELQVRRPSGRPQGIVNLGITLLDNKMRSMPLFADLCAAGGDFTEVSNGITNNDFIRKGKINRQTKDDQELEKVKAKDNSNAKLRRSSSDKTDLTSRDYSKHNNNNNQTPVGSIVAGSICNGSVVSDVGPSASVVAAAIAKGLYKTPAGGGDGLIEWKKANEEGEEGVKSKIERWRTEATPIYDSSKMRANSKQGGRARRRTDGGGLFSCFGNAFGCEVSITCGGSNGSRKKYQNGKVCHLSSVDDSCIPSYV